MEIILLLWNGWIFEKTIFTTMTCTRTQTQHLFHETHKSNYPYSYSTFLYIKYILLILSVIVFYWATRPRPCSYPHTKYGFYTICVHCNILVLKEIMVSGAFYDYHYILAYLLYIKKFFSLDFFSASKHFRCENGSSQMSAMMSLAYCKWQSYS